MAKSYLELMAEYQAEKELRDAATLARLREKPLPDRSVVELTAERMKENNSIMDTITAGHNDGMEEFMASARKKLEEMKANPPKEIA